MKNKNSYKYINLLARIIIGFAAVWYIYVKIKDDFLNQLTEIHVNEINYGLIAIAVVMLVLNWGVEAIKWRYTIRKIEKISILRAFNLTISGITIGLLTPNRIGEIPARALLLGKQFFKEVTVKTAVSSFSQVLITYTVGIIGLILTYHYFKVSANPLVLFVLLIFGLTVLCLIYFKVNKLEFMFNKIKYLREKEIFKALSEFSFKELLNIFFMSLLRYIIFSVQFYLVLKAFNVPLISINDVFLIAVCFMVASFIPTILISEIGIRGSVALLVFGTVSNLDIQIILASVLLWLINVALPALIGLFNLRELKILKEN